MSTAPTSETLLPNAAATARKTPWRASRSIVQRRCRSLAPRVLICEDNSAGTAATEDILERVGVATVPGSAFYRNPADGKNQLRFCYAKKMADLKDACARLRKLEA